MRLHVISDIHFEHMQKPDGDEFFKRLKELHAKSPAKVLVLAGDICQIGRHEAFFKARLAELCGYYERVIYVAGNHEHYSSSFPEVERFLDSVDLDPNLSNLIQLRHGPYVYFDGDKQYRFIGNTMWFPDTNEPYYNKRCMSDFHVITQFEPTVYQEHSKFLTEVMAQLRFEDIVVTHHLPLPECVDAMYKGSPLNPFFMVDMSRGLFEGSLPRLWIHGHTHTTVDLTKQVGTEKMRVYCNPFGYSNEGANLRFWDRVVIDI